MKCESCKINEVEIELSKDDGLENGIWDSKLNSSPYRLCMLCSNRLKKLALRPLELFNLVSIHGHGYHLHDDFYDYETGRATQPDIDIIDADTLPFPKFEHLKNDLNRLIDFSFVQYFTDDFVIKELQLFDKLEVLKKLKEKVEYNRDINYKAYEIAGKVVGRKAESWIKKEWEKRQENELQIFAESIAKCLDFNEGFTLIIKELEQGDEKFLSENISALLYFQSDKTLDWIEKISYKINNISLGWGQLSASSEFTWNRANKWLKMGRPLSLIALDSLIFCTTNGERLNQSLWMRQLNPKLKNSPKSDVIINKLKEYLLKDSVPRTKNSVYRIIDNIS